MVPAVFYLNLDIDDACSQANMNLCQGESGRMLAVALRESGKAYSPGEDCRAVCAGTRSDGGVFFNECRIENGLIYCRLDALVTACPGTVRAEMRLYGEGDVLIASPAFTISVRESAMDEGEIVQGEAATALTRMISEAQAALDAMAASSIREASVSLQENGGKPSASVELIPGKEGQSLAIAFENLKGDKGDRGEQGQAFTYDMFTPEQLAALTGPQGPVGNGISEAEVMEALIAEDMLPAITDGKGAIMTVSGKKVLLRY